MKPKSMRASGKKVAKPGSRGGKVIGTTKSGNPIYASSAKEYHDKVAQAGARGTFPIQPRSKDDPHMDFHHAAAVMHAARVGKMDALHSESLQKANGYARYMSRVKGRDMSMIMRHVEDELIRRGEHSEMNAVIKGEMRAAARAEALSTPNGAERYFAKRKR
jgi:hypothetical protein